MGAVASAQRIAKGRAAAPGEEGCDFNRWLFAEEPARRQLESLVALENMAATPRQWAEFLALEFAVRNRVAADRALRWEKADKFLARFAHQADTLPLRAADDGLRHVGPLPEDWADALVIWAEDLQDWAKEHDPGLETCDLLRGRGAQPAEAVPEKKRGGRPSKLPAARKKLSEIVQALGEFAAERGEAFNPMDMPGPLGKSHEDVGSFHWLCDQVDGPNGRLFRVAKRTFEDYRSEICAVQAYAKRTDFYNRALTARWPHIAPKIKPAEKIARGGKNR